MGKGLSDEQIYSLAEQVYFNVVEQLGIEDKCIEDNPDGEIGETRNTDYGRDLYFSIEATIQEFD